MKERLHSSSTQIQGHSKVKVAKGDTNTACIDCVADLEKEEGKHRK